MKTILHLDASANLKGSVSRRLTSGFVSDWIAANPDHKVIYRDLNVEHIPAMTSDQLEAMYAPAGTELSEKKRRILAASNALVDEFLSADMYVFGVPMYNFSVPGAFKSYMDQVIRVGKTTKPGPKGLEGAVHGRKMLVISTRAGDYSKGGPREDWDFHEPYLRKVFGWIGIKDFTYVPVMNSRDAELQEKRVTDAGLFLRGMAERWSAEHATEAAAAEAADAEAADAEAADAEAADAEAAGAGAANAEASLKETSPLQPAA
jgi:FMN-dependent NADH-azoreductase